MPSMHELGPDQCERLLRSQRIGRISLVTPDGVEVVPVNYAVHEGAVVVRTSPHGLLDRFAHGAHLAFEVDLVDEERWSGWSVIARGVGEVRDPDPGEERPIGSVARPWAEGERSRELRIVWHRLTGRLIGHEGTLRTERRSAR